MKRAAVWLILLVTFIGLADSAYLVKEKMLGNPLICNIEGLSGCNIVAQSPYADLWGIPVAAYGVAFYVLLFIVTAVELIYMSALVRRVIQLLAVVGIIASSYFMYIQIAIIDAFCIYCAVSALATFLIFVLAYFIEPLTARRMLPPIQPPTRPEVALPPLS